MYAAAAYVSKLIGANKLLKIKKGALMEEAVRRKVEGTLIFGLCEHFTSEKNC